MSLRLLLIAGLIALPCTARAQAVLPQYALGGTIAAANVYQKLQFPALNDLPVRDAFCPHGGVIENTSNTDQANAFVERLDFSGLVNAATTPSPPTIGATTIDPASTAGRAGGKQTIPPTTNGIWISGPVGATYKGYCS